MTCDAFLSHSSDLGKMSLGRLLYLIKREVCSYIHKAGVNIGIILPLLVHYRPWCAPIEVDTTVDTRFLVFNDVHV